jgi:hypothetical protein
MHGRLPVAPRQITRRTQAGDGAAVRLEPGGARPQNAHDAHRHRRDDGRPGCTADGEAGGALSRLQGHRDRASEAYESDLGVRERGRRRAVRRDRRREEGRYRDLARVCEARGRERTCRCSRRCSRSARTSPTSSCQRRACPGWSSMRWSIRLGASRSPRTRSPTSVAARRTCRSTPTKSVAGWNSTRASRRSRPTPSPRRRTRSRTPSRSSSSC